MDVLSSGIVKLWSYEVVDLYVCELRSCVVVDL